MALTFADLLRDPFAPRDYLVTVQPHAIARGSISVAAGGVYASAGKLFKGLMAGDILAASGFAVAGKNDPLVVTQVDPAGGWIVTARATTAEAAGSGRLIQGVVTRYFSTHGYTTGPAETPANAHYDDGVEVALRFSRSLFNGGFIGGQSIPGFGDVVLQNTDGSRDHFRRWGWAGKRITVELGAPTFARADYGVIFDGLTGGVEVTDETVTIQISDFQALLDRIPWSPAYRGSGGLEGTVDTKSLLRPLAYGWVHHCQPQFVGIVGGRHVYQFHDGEVAAYDATWHELYDQGVPLPYQPTLASLVPGQWHLDVANGLVILGGSPAGTISMRTKGCAFGGTFVDTTAAIIRRIAQTRLILDTDLSTTSNSVGTGSKAWTVPSTMRFAVGVYALVAKTDDMENVWMFGPVTAWNPGTGLLTVNVTRSSGAGAGVTNWTVAKIGFADAELDLPSFTALDAAAPAKIGIYLAEEQTALETFDFAVSGVGGHFGFTRAGLFQLGRYVAPTGTPALTLDGADVLALTREPTDAPVWWAALGYARNWGVLSGNDIAASVRENAVTGGTFDSASGWTVPAGWAIGGGVATATAAGTTLTRPITLVVGQRYTLRADVTVTAGSVTFQHGATAIGAAVSASASIAREFVAAAGSTAINMVGSGFSGTVDNVSITATRLAFLQTEYRYTTPVTDGQVRTIYGPTSPQLLRETPLRDEADAQAETQRLLALFSQPADLFRVSAKTEPFSTDVGAETLLIDATRFGLQDGLSNRILQIEEDASDNRVNLLVRG